MRKSILGIVGLVVAIFIAIGFFNQYEGGKETTEAESVTESQEEEEAKVSLEDLDQTYYYKAKGDSFYTVIGDKEEAFFVKGVNLGLGKPGYFPGEIAITKEEYERWFEMIGEMNSNTIRVYTVQAPEFYEAFYEYNKTHDKPLYLLHGIWYDEAILEQSFDVFDEGVLDAIYRDIKNLTDIFHGDAVIEKTTGHAGGEYKWDISPYVMGWVLGIETDAKMIEVANENNPEKTSYDGTYFWTENASAVEVLWTMMADYATTYEMENYGMQRPISFSNWLTTDILTHPDEPFEKEDAYELNEQKLKCKEKFEAGVFATYHIYPYYPDFLYLQEEYTSYVDEDGKVNTYKAYLEDLKAAYDIPVLVGEFGVPASRGKTHENPFSHFDQGNMEESGQSEAILSMLNDIVDTGYAGALIFTWQDEWFKRTWNTMDYSNPNRRAYWCDVQTSEQHYGIMEFVPSTSGLPIVIDGDKWEWTKDYEIASNDSVSLSARTDAAYLYLMVEAKDMNFAEDELIIPMDVTPDSGSRKYEQYNLSWPADFVIKIDGENDSRVLVQSYYDIYSYDYAKYDADIRVDDEVLQKDSAVFNPIYLLLEKELTLPESGRIIPLVKFETGKLTYGTTDEDSEDYNSLTDFCYQNGVLEIRIPWALIGFRDPSQKEIQHDFRAAEYHGGNYVDGLTLGVYGTEEEITFAHFTWDNWDMTNYTERLRKVYYDLQERFGEIN